MRVVLAMVMVFVVALQQRAEACSCSGPDPILTNDRVVPTNVQIPILGLLQATTFELLDENGANVPVTTETVPGGFVLVPTAPLQPNTGYVVEPLISRYSGQGFRTGDGPGEPVSVPAPTLGTFTRYVIDGSSACGGPGESFHVNVSEAMGEPTIHEVFVGSTTDTIDTSAPAFFFRARPILFLSEVSICEPKFPTASRSDLAIAIRTRDLAGNVSPLSNAIQLKSGGCTATGAPALLLLAGLLARPGARGRRRE